MSDDGLRELPPAQSIRSPRGLLARARYVPLIILAVLVVAATVMGVVIKGASPAGGPTTASGLPRDLPVSCAPGVDQKLSGEPWLDAGKKDASEASFQSNIATADPAYVEGKDGWLFFNDVQINDFSQGVGRVNLNSDQLTAWSSYLAGLKKDANDHGSSFYIVIAPAKWDVYPQQLPDWAQKLRGTVSFDQLLTAHPELPIIDTRAALRKAGETEDTYSKQDSHWTGYGAYVAWKDIVSCLGENDPTLAGLHASDISGVTLQADHNEFGPQGVVTAQDWTSPTYSEPHADTTVTSLTTGAVLPPTSDNFVDMTELPAETTTKGAQSELSALVLRDSTGNALAPGLTESFAKTVQVSHRIGDPDHPLDLTGLLTTYTPNVTFFVMTERYLAYGPPSAG